MPLDRGNPDAGAKPPDCPWCSTPLPDGNPAALHAIQGAYKQHLRDMRDPAEVRDHAYRRQLWMCRGHDGAETHAGQMADAAIRVWRTWRAIDDPIRGAGEDTSGAELAEMLHADRPAPSTRDEVRRQIAALAEKDGS